MGNASKPCAEESPPTSLTQLLIWTAVLLGLVLNPALADYSQKTNGNQQIIFGGDSQITITGISQGVKLNSQTRVAIIEQKSQTLSWKTIWNYNRGVIATKITQQNTCYISIMNRTDIPSFNSLARLAAESRNLIGVLGRHTKEITFVTSGLVNNLYSYGTEIAAMCSGVTTYMAYEVHGLQANLGSCITLNVLRAVDLRYCNSNGNWNGSIFNHTQVIIGGHSQIVTINRQWRVAIIEQTSISGSWKTIWNYNTGVIATKVTQQNICYISTMNRNEMPRFDNLARLAEESRNLIGGFGRPNKRITFVTNGLVNNLYSYGADIMAMCSGVTTYMATEVHSPQVNLGSCITLDVLRVVELQYCSSNGNWNNQWNNQWNGNWNNNWTNQWNGNWNNSWNGNWNNQWNGNWNHHWNNQWNGHWNNWTNQWDGNQWNNSWNGNWNNQWNGNQWNNSWNGNWNNQWNGNWNNNWNNQWNNNWNGNWNGNFPVRNHYP
ncbi:protein PF3D7_1417600-like [Melozone crissalis]|uniref:protein PF3D7_1417600-like n=1 Tax=Melozone crissalis TaxID=40204 RepID=UPI0023DC07E0|nr:protein PF3D7_1417600-like [Melozone crissalis]